MEDNDEKTPSEAIAEPVGIRISKAAFDNCGDYKKGILRQIRKRVANAKFESSGSTYLDAISPQVLIWYFDPQEFLKVIKEYPWLLDANLGEKSDDDLLNYKMAFNKGYYGKP